MLWYCRTFQLYPGAGQVRGHVSQMMAVVAEGKNGRIYLSPDLIQEEATAVLRPETYPDGELFGKAAVMFLCMA